MSSASPNTNHAPMRSVLPMFVAGLLMILAFWGATELIRSWIGTGSNYEAEQGELRVKNLQDLTETNRTELSGYTWVDRGAGTVRIPIERAMELEIVTLNEGKPTPSTLIDPEAAAAEAAAKGTSATLPDATTPAIDIPAEATTAPVPAQEAATEPLPPADPVAPAPAESTPVVQ